MILGAIVYKAGIRASVSRVMKGVEKLERGKTNRMSATLYERQSISKWRLGAPSDILRTRIHSGWDVSQSNGIIHTLKLKFVFIFFVTHKY